MCHFFETMKAQKCQIEKLGIWQLCPLSSAVRNICGYIDLPLSALHDSTS
jgi:hypothetical protein